MKTILVPTDFSKSSENALNFAVQLAQQFKSRIILMHAYETPVVFTDATVAAIQLDVEDLRETSLKQLKKAYSKVLETVKGAHFDLVVQEGLPSARTLEIAIEKKADMIVMATTASTQVQRFLIGSNASRVLRDAPCMTLLVPPKAKFSGMKKIVYSTDLTDENLIAANSVVELAKFFKSEMIFLNIDNQTLVHDDSDLVRVTQRIRHFVTYPKMKGYVCTDLNVADGITYFLKHQNADCLAMATHHRKFIQAITNPSVTKRVAYKTDLPLLVVHVGE
jgi:nucleotide-binding universal stress UspA family protein